MLYYFGKVSTIYLSIYLPLMSNPFRRRRYVRFVLNYENDSRETTPYGANQSLGESQALHNVSMMRFRVVIFGGYDFICSWFPNQSTELHVVLWMCIKVNKISNQHFKNNMMQHMTSVKDLDVTMYRWWGRTALYN